jgi:hypothetical protein
MTYYPRSTLDCQCCGVSGERRFPHAVAYGIHITRIHEILP